MKSKEEVLTETIRAINPNFNYGDTHVEVFTTLHFCFDPQPAMRVIYRAMESYLEQNLNKHDVSVSLPCNHNFLEQDPYWKRCLNCGMIAPLRQ